MNLEERRKWGESVVSHLRKEADLEQDEVVFLAGKRYREFLTPYIKNYKVPMEGLGIGKQLKFLKQNMQNQSMILIIQNTFLIIKALLKDCILQEFNLLIQK